MNPISKMCYLRIESEVSTAIYNVMKKLTLVWLSQNKFKM